MLPISRQLGLGESCDNTYEANLLLSVNIVSYPGSSTLECRFRSNTVSNSDGGTIDVGKNERRRIRQLDLAVSLIAVFSITLHALLELVHVGTVLGVGILGDRGSSIELWSAASFIGWLSWTRVLCFCIAVQEVYLLSNEVFTKFLGCCGCGRFPRPTRRLV